MSRRRAGAAPLLLAFLYAYSGSALSAPPAGSDSPTAVRLTHDGFEKRRPSWSPDGRRLAFARHEADGEHIWQYVADADRPDSPRRLLRDRATPHFDATYAPDGKRLLLVAIRFVGPQGILDIARLEVDGSNLKVVSPDKGGRAIHQEWPAWSPDGKRFAFSSTHEGNQEIYTASTNGTDLVRLTRHPGHDAHPCWSPDGRQIAFASDRWGGLELAAVDPEGTRVTRLTKSPGLDDYPAYAPDGRRLAFVSNRDGQYEIYVAGSDGSHPANLTRHPARDTFPTWSPDGRGVTFVSDRDRGFDLYSLRVP